MTSCIARSDTATCHCEGFSPRQSLGGKALSLGRLLRFARNDGVKFFIRAVFVIARNEVTWQSWEAKH